MKSKFCELPPKAYQNVMLMVDFALYDGRANYVPGGGSLSEGRSSNRFMGLLSC